MSIVINVPQVSVNDEFVTLIEWRKEKGEFIQRGDLICLIETTKAVIDVEAESDGYLSYNVLQGESLKVGSLLAVLSKSKDEDVSKLFASDELTKVVEPITTEKRWTKKAAIVAKKLGIDIESLASEMPTIMLTEADVTEAQKRQNQLKMPDVKTSALIGDIVDDEYAKGREERILILGGGGGAMLAIDIISQTKGQRAVGVLDNNTELHGKRLMGIPILGKVNDVEKFWEMGICDSIIISFMTTPAERAEYFEKLLAQGIKFTNIIDPTASIRLNVAMGVGNLIVNGGYLAPCVTIGDNNFLACNTSIEHNSIVGSHCMFGPRFTASGRVEVGNRVRFGMGVLVEPYIKIGDEAIIASGSVLTMHVKAKETIRTKLNK